MLFSTLKPASRNWIVLGRERQVEIYRRPENGHYQEMQLFGSGHAIECVSIPAVRLQVSDLFA